MDKLIQLFSDLDYLAECASNVDLSKYTQKLRTETISSEDCSEQGAYFCAVSKSDFTSIGDAFPYFFIHNLYISQEWKKDEPRFDIDHRSTWKHCLKTAWLPEYLSIRKGKNTVNYRTVTELYFFNDWLPIAYVAAPLAIKSPIKNIVRYGNYDAWNFSDYLIETEFEYIDFQYWTNA